MKLTRAIPALSLLFSIVQGLPQQDARNGSASSGGDKDTPVIETDCKGRSYEYNGLAGFGFLPSDARDKFGDTIGGPSSAAFDKASWKATGSDTYEVTAWFLPDRGWNTQGTLNYQPRLHKVSLKLVLKPDATAASPSPANLDIKYLDTVLLSSPDGNPTTGLRPDKKGPYLQYRGFPDLPSATYTGDGFGGTGPGGRRISLDTEGLVLAEDGSFWISDEYGPYIYRFSQKGKMLSATAPPNAFLPRRNGTVSFATDDPPVYAPDDQVIPKAVDSGRANNQGLEGLTVSKNGKELYALMQSALAQEGGTGNPTRKQARLLKFKIRDDGLKYDAEYVVTLPLYADGKKVAAQSEIHFLGDDQFFVLARDSGYGGGQKDTKSLYRQADVFDISRATDLKKSANDDAPTAAIADAQGNLKDGIRAAQYCPFLNFNVDDELAKFGLRNGGAQGNQLLNEKWEALEFMEIEKPKKGKGSRGKGKGKDYLLFAFSDNDFITQNGFTNSGKNAYKDKSGFNLNSQALVFHVSVEK